jgi:hypothetical protein
VDSPVSPPSLFSCTSCTAPVSLSRLSTLGSAVAT